MLSISNTFSQTTISGRITDEVGKPLSNATITLNKISEAAILGYDISNASGEFLLKFENEADSLQIKFSYVGFKSKKLVVSNKNQTLNVQLPQSSEVLKEVIIKSEIIEKRGDTLNYAVSAFKDQNDRVIADVLRKMPGIEVKADGSVHYQGKPIEKYYIEGMDLLEGRYSLANENLNADAVSKVQVLENHQPIKLLDSLVFSENTSLNIKLKKDVTWSGTAELGAGFSPLLWDVNITPMLFAKKQQAIFSYQSNNIGNEVSSALNDFSFAFDPNEISFRKTDLLSIRQVSSPPFAEERWLDNNVHLISGNYLVRLKENLDLKLNVSYVNDVQEQIGRTETRIFTANDTIDVLENVNNDMFRNYLNADLIVERNSDENYLKNELSIDKYWDSERGIITNASETVFQDLENPFAVINNNFEMLKPVGKQLVNFKSQIGYSKTPQSLEIMPGQFEDLLNEGNSYSTLQQDVEISNFFTNNSAGLTKAFGAFTLTPKVGFSIQNQELESELNVITEENETELGSEFQNHLNFFNSKIYFSTGINYKSDSWRIRLQLPISYTSYKINDDNLNEEQNLNRPVFEPNLYVQKEFSSFLKTSISAGLNQDFGDINQLYYGYILTNYRSLQRYNASLSEQNSQNYRWRFSYRNPLTAVFASLSYSFQNSKNNLLFSSTINENGASVLEAIVEDNYSNSHNFNLRGSKYWSKLNTTLSFETSFSISDFERIINNDFINVENERLQLSLKADSELTDWLSMNYETSFSVLETSFAENDFEPIKTQQHKLDFTIFPAENQYFSLNSEAYFNDLGQEESSSYFLNLKYQYSFEKDKIDLSLRWNNILNTDEFVNISSNEYSYIRSIYHLRPSQVLLSLNFNF